MNDIRLTALSRGGGCGCKVASNVLGQMLEKLPIQKVFPNLLVGIGDNDDAAVYYLNEQQAIIATTDFFMPIVDDPYEFGRIAATNALSDIYAMGGRPILALAVVGMPINKLSMSTIQQILAGGVSVCDMAGIPLAGGHSIETTEPIYGLVALGLVHPCKVKRNDRAQIDDVLILGKPLGIGILSAALKNDLLSDIGYHQMIKYTTQLNSVGSILGNLNGIHAMTDITGFGLVGHLLEVCKGSNLGAEIIFNDIPLIETAVELALQGISTGGGNKNWINYKSSLEIDGKLTESQRVLLCDPQTSGGLLVTCATSSVENVLNIFRMNGFDCVRQIGRMRAGNCTVKLKN
ncbi:selenide, water dikinase SelD [Nitrosomonas ureae]|uniref:Selenide, water dikinase n=1 Tax=Nitrosomonas ureae TaxID=44577 RepID=A0A1H2GQ32_9PROT|nr:selenide, water dikinase SelD [Nitrosomonas ureae]ALQ51138.1 selenide, water dikinase [Nitrosomonas ureae]SDU21615.1 selenophosphate synthase [Nitrosomonas ureae]